MPVDKADARRTAFVAGAGGAVGRVLCALLVADGWRVVGSTRSRERSAQLEAQGVEPVIVDVFDRAAVIEAVVAAAPEVVVHQLTDLPRDYSSAALAAASPGNARIREIGTAHLVDAAKASDARRLVAQSIAFAYAPGPRPHDEAAPLDAAATAVARLEALVLGGGLQGIVLRYGRFYGPGTWFNAPTGKAPVHVHAAADAARRAMARGKLGVYNIAEEDGSIDCAKARRELGWDAGFRLGL